MARNPLFTVVLATYGRGMHIKPTIESVLDQSFPDFELIVAGDGCVDETELVLRSFESEKIVWCNLPHNTGSQSFPNNEGILHARGSWICYLGHDDIWAPDHLAILAQTIESNEDSYFVVSGCICYGPRESGFYLITGLFDTPETAKDHFFPPSSFAHRRDVIKDIGEWRDPRTIPLPPDEDFLLRAVYCGLHFVSTGRITVHKFTGGHRYLSYLQPCSDEQREMLETLRSAREIALDKIIETAKRTGGYMTLLHTGLTSTVGTFNLERGLRIKGIVRPPLQPLLGRRVIEQTDELRALDWYWLEGTPKPHRWSGPNPRPRLLIPFTGGRARISIEVIATRPGLELNEIGLYVGHRRAVCTYDDFAGLGATISAEISLDSTNYTVLTFETPMFFPYEHYETSDRRYLGLAVADIIIEPIPVTANCATDVVHM